MFLLVNYYCCSCCLFYFCISFLFCCAVLSVISSFAIISLGKREREKWLLKNCFLCHGTFSAMCLFLAVQWVGLQGVIVVFPGHILPTFFMRI